MLNQTVIGVVDYRTLKVSPGWVLSDSENKENDKIGDEIRIVGIYPMSIDDYEKIKRRLNDILINENVNITNEDVIIENNNPVVCGSVVLDNTDISFYFPEYSSVHNLVHS